MSKKEEKIIEAEVEEKKTEIVNGHDKAYFFPRAIAYFIDILIVALVSSLIIQFVPANKNYEKEEYKQIQEDFTSKKIGIEEYMNKSVPVVYDIDYSNCSSMIIEVTALLLYFIVFQTYNKGQTLGKKLMKIRIVSNNGNEASINQIAIRSLIVNSILANLLIIGALLFSGRDVYYYISLGLQGVEGLIVMVTLIMILFRNDGRGIHDLLAKTQVISC